MKIKLIVLIIISIALLSACVVRPNHKRPKVWVKVPVTTLVAHDQEHRGKTILVVNAKPATSRNCWTHKKHWHCNR